MKTILFGSEGFIGSRFQKRMPVFRYDLRLGMDIRDTFMIDEVFRQERPEVVVNMAARAGVQAGEDFYEEFISTNCIGLMNIIKACEKYDVKKFVHFSSSAASKALSVYGATKRMGDILVKNSKLDYSIIVPYTVIGENGRKDMVLQKWVTQYKRGQKITFYGDGTTFRGYTYVEDLLDGVKKAIDAHRGIYNIGGDQKVTLEELWTIFKEVYPEAEREILPLPGYDEPGELADTSYSQEVLGWKHKTDIKKKLKEILLCAEY